MPRITRPDYICFPEGLMHKSMLRNSEPSEVKTYSLTPEERQAAIEKYGPILQPLHRKLVRRKAR